MKMLEYLNFTGKNIIVTGASSGIGQQTAIQLSQLGANILLVGRNEEALRQTYQLMAKGDHNIELADLADTEAILTWMKSWAKTLGGFDGLVHSAGLHSSKPLRFLKAGEIERLLSVNVTAALYLAKAFRQSEVHNLDSSIVYLASVVGLVGQPGISVYSASKGAIVALTKSLALELANESIRVNCIAPGIVETKMTQKLFSVLDAEQVESIVKAHPLGLGKTTDIANAVSFLLSVMSRWITGTTLIVDGGYTAQ